MDPKYGITKKEKQVKQFYEKDKLSSDGVTESIEDETKHSEKFFLTLFRIQQCACNRIQ